MLYDSRKSNISRIERESGVKFEHLSAPQPADVAKAAGVEAVETINQISDRYTQANAVLGSILIPFQIIIYVYSQCNSFFQVCCGGIVKHFWSICC